MADGIPLNAQNLLPLQTQQALRFLPLTKNKVGPLKPAAPAVGDKAAQLRKAAKDFESIFLFQVMKQMRNTIHQEDMFHGGPGEDMFTQMLDEEMTKKMAGRGATGLADMIYNQLSRQYGIGDSGSGTTASNAPSLPGLSDPAGVLLQKLRSAQAQTHAQLPPNSATDL